MTDTATDAGLTATCPNGHEIAFERHPGAWGNHPEGVRVKVECAYIDPETGAACGATTYTDGVTEADYVQGLYRDITRQAMDDAARRLGEQVQLVVAGDSGEATGEQLTT